MNQIQIQQNAQIKELLQEAINENKISGWKIHSYKKRKNNIYIQKDYKIESILSTQRNESQIAITKNFEDQIGESSFTISEADSIEKVKDELEDAIFICSQSKSKKYEPVKKDAIEVNDNHIKKDEYFSQNFINDFESGSLNILIAQKIETLKKIIEQKSTDQIKLKLNALEFLNNISEGSFQSSQEINKTFKKTYSYMELVLTAINQETKKETEHIVYQKIANIYEFDFEQFFENQTNYVLDTAKENKAQSFTGKVLLTNSATKDFFNPDLGMNSVIAHCIARLKYLKLSQYEIGDQITNGKYDKLTIYSNPSNGSNVDSLEYDDDGIAARKLCLIKDNTIENFAASKKYADYTGNKPTGPLGPFEIQTGSKKYDELTNDSEKQIEIVTFASFSPDMISGDFSAEIRLGYTIENGKKTPFKGGLFTGNIIRLLEEVELSQEKIEEAGYIGPKTIKFHKAEIVGL